MPRVAAVTAVRKWVNAHPTLVGKGRPLLLGAHRARLRSPGQGAYVLLSRVGGSSALLAEEGVDRARVSGLILAGTDEAAELAATAYAAALDALSGAPAAMGDATCLVADNVAGPLLIDGPGGNDQYAYAVDADFYLI
ncbi:hypothetical protein [Streptosporangium longisporum]|uniref:Uncharacterized protein n=1 Tax=Streptosporangium longisporum TaxID=46187 RepID=A0ABP6L320_9ACTN